MDLATGIWVGSALFLLILVLYLVWEIRRGKKHGHTWFTWFKPRGHSDVGAMMRSSAPFDEAGCSLDARRRAALASSLAQCDGGAYRKGSGALCSAICCSNHVWNSSAVWTVTNPRIRA